jgi:protein SCO1/2
MSPSLPIALIVATLSAEGAVDLDQVPTPPPTFPASGVEVIEQLGATVPLDLALRDHAGADVTLGAVLAGDVPTILTFNYTRCQTLCSLQLAGLTRSLASLPWRVGRQFRIVTVVLDPDEPLDRVRATRDRYVAELPPGSDAAGWTFVTPRTRGDGAPIRAVADAVGVRFEYLAERGEWAHPAVLVFLSSAGRVTRYVHGVDYPTDVMLQSITRAGTDEPSAGVGFLLRCFSFDPHHNDYSKMGRLAMRYAAAGFLVLVLSGFGLARVLRRQRRALGDRP